ncbi:MAG TPA: hypothetical protein VF818_03920 [Ktedonobacterales bacterium]
MSQQQMNTGEIQHDLRATLSARREMGPEYDDHLVESFMRKLDAQLPALRGARMPASDAPSAGQRLALAVVSLALLIPLVGMVMWTTGGNLIALTVLCAAVVLVNLAFARGR